MLQFSDNGLLDIKASNFPVHGQKVQERNSISLYAFILIFYMFSTTYVFCISYEFIE